MKHILNVATRPHLGYPGYEKPPEDNFWPPRSAHGKWSNLWLPKQKCSPNSFWFNHVKMFLENHIEPYGSTPAGAGGWPRTCHTQVPPQVLVRLAHRRPQPPATWNNFAAVGVLGSKLLGHASIFGRMAEQMQTVRFSDVFMQSDLRIKASGSFFELCRSLWIGRCKSYPQSPAGCKLQGSIQQVSLPVVTPRNW